MAAVFISYSRKDIAFARLLHQALLDHEMETWIDWQDIPPSVDWLAEVYEAIEQAETFIFIISETSLLSEVCRLEIAHAEGHNKRLIPIVINDIDPQTVPAQLAALNWIFFREGDEFAGPLADLIEAIQVDQDWVKEHTRCLNRALEWERAGKSPGLLLRGANLEAAERWLSGAAEKSPPPTPLHSQYILASCQDAVRRQRITLSAVLGVLGISIIVGLMAWLMRNTAVREEHVRATAEAQAVAESHVRATAEALAEAEAIVRATAQQDAETQRQIAVEESEVALSRQLAAQALNHLDRLDLALLLSAEASFIVDTREARGSLLSGLSLRPHLQAIWHSDLDTALTILAESMDRKFSLLWNGSSARAWDWGKESLMTAPLITPAQDFEDAAIDDDGMVTFIYLDGTLARWPLDAKNPSIVAWNVGAESRRPDLARFSPDAQRFATGHGEVIRIWDAESGEAIGEPLTNPGWLVTGLAFHPSGDGLAAGYEDPASGAGSILYWDLNLGVVQGDAFPLLENDGAVTSLLFHPQGSILATVGSSLVEAHIENKAVRRFWNLETGEELGVRNIFPSEDVDMAFNADGEYFALRHEDVVEIKRWSGEYYGFVAEFTPGSAHGGLFFTPDGLNLATGGPGGSIYMWDRAARDALFQHRFEDSGNCMYLAFSPDGERLFSDCWLKGVVLWDVATGERLQTHEQAVAPSERIYDEEPNAVAFSPDGTRIASGYVDHSVVLWDAETLTPIGEPLRGNGGDILDLAFSPDGRWLIAGSTADKEGYPLVIWRAEDGQQVRSFNVEPIPFLTSFAVSPVGDRIVVGGGDGQKKVLGYVDGVWEYLAHGGAKPTIHVTFEGVVTDNLVFRQDGGLLAASSGKVLYIYDVENRQVVSFPFEKHEDEIRSIAFSPDGGLLASGSGDNSNLKIGKTITLWDFQTGMPINPSLPGEGMNIVYDLAFSPDGLQLASYSGASDLVLWDVSLEAWQAYACQIANRNLTEAEWATYLGERPYRQTCPATP